MVAAGPPVYHPPVPSEVHVLHVVRTLGHGGMEQNLRRVVIELGRRGLRHSILLLHDHPGVISFPPEVPIHRVVTAPRDPRMIAKIWRMLNRLRPTVIHCRNWGSWPDTALARLLTVPRLPLVFSYHGMEGREVSRSLRLKFQAMARITTRIFAVSDAARTLLVDDYGLPRARIGVICNGVDTVRFQPRPLDAPRRRTSRLVVAAIGRLYPIKNLPLLMRAVDRVAAGGLDLELRIAGEGPEQQRLEALARTLRAGDRMVFLGHVQDVASVVRDADVYVLSSDNEANPNSLLEAMACGVPCISTDVGNVSELFDQGRAGIMVPPGDDAVLAAAIERLARAPELRASLGAAARARVVARYATGRMYDAYEALYRAPREAALA